MTLIHDFYVTNFADPLGATKPVWFVAFSATEFLLQLPLAIWLVPALKNANPIAPLIVLIYGFLGSLTTWVSIAELWLWDEQVLGVEGKVKLVGIYAVYGIICKTFIHINSKASNS